MTTRTKTVATSPWHETLREDLIRLIQRTAPDKPADEILAVVCVLVGQLVALQDQRRFSPDAVMAIVAANIEAGNKAVIDGLISAPGGRA